MKMRTTQEMKNEMDALSKEIYAEEKIIATLPPYVICDAESAQKRAMHQTNRADLLQRVEVIAEGKSFGGTRVCSSHHIFGTIIIYSHLFACGNMKNENTIH